MTKKIQVFHFHNGKMGGVRSVISNLLKYSNNPNIENHLIYTINKDIDSNRSFPVMPGSVSEQVFLYSAKWNFYHTCKQLAKLLPDDKAVVIAHDWLELGMMSNLGLQNPVVQIVHGGYDYYYDLCDKHSHVIDTYICISPKIFQSLEKKLPKRLNDIFYLNFPVPYIVPKRIKNEDLQLFYCVRDLNDKGKQFSTIIAIAQKLVEFSGKYFFTIAGAGLTQEEFFSAWPEEMRESVKYLGFKTNAEILEILPDFDIFLLPSTEEGFPVSLVEAMKAGVVPLVSNWSGAVEELVVPAVTGYYFEIGAAQDYAAKVKMLQADRPLLNRLSQNCIQKANELFDPINNTRKFEELFHSISETPLKKKIAKRIYGSRLEKKWIPNFVVSTIRNLNK